MLTNAEIRKAAVELDQTGIAVQAVGRTSRQKLAQMASLADGIASQLHGTRPEILRARFALETAIQAVRSAPTKGAIPGQRLRDLATEVGRLSRLVARSLVSGEVAFKVGGFEVHNAWGYTKHETREAKQALSRAGKRLKDVGLEKLASVRVELDPSLSPRGFADYNPLSEVLALNLSKGTAGNVRDVLRALAGRAWVSLRQDDYETWGGPSKSSRFEKAFADLLVGGPGKIDLDALVRLETTVGRQASNWPTSPP